MNPIVKEIFNSGNPWRWAMTLKSNYMNVNDKVWLIEDKQKEVYTIVKKLGISNGPIGQHEPSQVWGVIDMRGHHWQFREDALEIAKPLSPSYVSELERTVIDVRNEVLRAKSMFPTNFHNQHEGYAVILEELDELWREVKKNQKIYDLPAQRKEAIQTAAMLFRFIVELTPKI